MIDQDNSGQVPDNAKPPKREETLGESIRFLLLLLLAVFAIRSFVVEPFNIPSGSMLPTLQIGDFVLVSKSSYGYSRYSLPFGLNLFQGRIFSADPHRGDVAVFRFTKDTSIDYIKRIVGLPGDHIQVTNGRLLINGVELPRVPRGHYEVFDERHVVRKGEMYDETIPGSGGRPPVVHNIYKEDDESFANNTPEYVVPEGYFFAMGDNRDDSADSRFQGGPGDLGYVPIQNLVGRAPVVLFSIDETNHPLWAFWYWPVEIRWNRLFHFVK